MNDRDLTVFLVDDDAAVRQSLSLLVASEGYTVQAYAGAEDFLAVCKPQMWGCAVIDLNMPGMDGLRLQEELARRAIRLPIIFLTGYGDIQTGVKAIKAGAFDFLTKPVAGIELLRIIAAAFAEAKRRHAEADRQTDAESRLARLTSRERGVFKLAVAGFANKEIASLLGISYRTVEIHRGRILHKTGAVSLLELVQLAKDACIIE